MSWKAWAPPLVQLLPLVLGALGAVVDRAGVVSESAGSGEGGHILRSPPEAKAENGGNSPVVSTLLLVVGILLLIAAFRKWRKQPNPDDPSSFWMQSIAGVTVPKALSLGALLVAIGSKL